MERAIHSEIQHCSGKITSNRVASIHTCCLSAVCSHEFCTTYNLENKWNTIQIIEPFWYYQSGRAISGGSICAQISVVYVSKPVFKHCGIYERDIKNDSTRIRMPYPCVVPILNNCLSKMFSIRKICLEPRFGFRYYWVSSSGRLKWKQKNVVDAINTIKRKARDLSLNIVFLDWESERLDILDFPRKNLSTKVCPPFQI